MPYWVRIETDAMLSRELHTWLMDHGFIHVVLDTCFAWFGWVSPIVLTAFPRLLPRESHTLEMCLVAYCPGRWARLDMRGGHVWSMRPHRFVCELDELEFLHEYFPPTAPTGRRFSI